MCGVYRQRRKGRSSTETATENIVKEVEKLGLQDTDELVMLSLWTLSEEGLVKWETVEAMAAAHTEAGRESEIVEALEVACSEMDGKALSWARRGMLGRGWATRSFRHMNTVAHQHTCELILRAII